MIVVVCPGPGEEVEEVTTSPFTSSTSPVGKKSSFEKSMGCAASAPVLEEGAAPTVPRKEALALAKKALVTPPIPLGHALLAGFAKALDLEYGDAAEKEAISTWMTLELEARPKQHFDDMGTDLATCTRFVADVEKAVKEKCVTIETLCEKWGTPEVKPKPKVVSLGDVKGDISAQQQEQVPRRSQPTGADGDSIDDDSIDRDLGGEPNADGRPGGDGRYN